MTKRTDISSSHNNPFAQVAFATKNPFAAAAPSETRLTETGYAITASGPAVDPAEVENAAVSAVEITILWGSSILAVRHLAPARSFFVGEADSAQVRCDFMVPEEKLGAPSAPLMLQEGERSFAVLLPGATGTIEMPGRSKLSFDEAEATGMFEPCVEAGVAGARKVQLQPGMRVRSERSGLIFQVASVVAGRKIGRSLLGAASASALLFSALSFAAHSAVLGGMAFFKPDLDGVQDEEDRRAQMVLMQQFLKASAEKEQEATQETTDAPADSAPGGTGAKAKGAEGSMGHDLAKPSTGKYGVKGPKDNPDPHIAREHARQEAASFGLIGLLQAGAGGDAGPVADWGRDTALGRDAQSANGAMWGTDIGENFGAGGLGLSGIGIGSGGTHEGIGQGNVGTIGRGRGLGDDQGFGNSHGQVRGNHTAKSTTVRMSSPSVSGHVPPEVIQRIVRQNFGRFRLCYENGLRQNPNLQGRVSVRFVIGRDGAVSSVGNGGSDLPDSAVVSCVVRSFSGLSFPAPDAGIVTVIYPISFSPGT